MVDPDVAEDLTAEFLPNTTATQTQIETLLQKTWKNMENHGKNCAGAGWIDMK